MRNTPSGVQGIILQLTYHKKIIDKSNVFGFASREDSDHPMSAG